MIATAGSAILVVLAAVALVAFVIGTYYYRQRRRDELAAFASKYNLQYARDDPFAIDSSIPAPLLGMGDGRKCENVVWGTYQGIPVKAFDYWYYKTYYDEHGSHRTYYRFSCALTEISINCSSLSIAPENLETKIEGHLGFHDIQFEEEQFNKTWNVKSADPKFANDFIDQRMMQFLMYAGTKYSFQTVGPYVLAYSHKLPIDQVHLLMDCTRAFIDHIPAVTKSLYPLS